MDGLTRQIAEFAATLGPEDLPEPVMQGAEQRVLDSLGCAVAAHDAAPVEIALAALAPGGGTGGRVIGMPRLRPGREAAAFLNGSMIRYLDFNDWAPNAHPSDVIGPLVALVDRPGITGSRFLTSTVVGYEVLLGITEAAGLAGLGWDQGFAVGIATVAAIGNLRGLEADVIGNAVGMMAAVGLPTGATRSGALSMWKGMATAFAARNAVLLCELASRGLTGPDAAFQGRRGIWSLVTGPFELELPVPRSDNFRLSATAIKAWPVCYHAQAPVEAALALRRRVPPADLERLEVLTYAEAWRSTASEPAKWDPQTRETADHSLPYLVARALHDGAITSEAFEPRAYCDPAVRATMRKITASVGDDAAAAYPESIMATITAWDRDGHSHRVDVTNPIGHPARPMTRPQLLSKFDSLVDGHLGPIERDRVVEAWSNLRHRDDVESALDLLDVTAGRA